ncbi:MAG: hypothetical protein WC233_08145 [Sphaerochaeta sp.]|jgi:uncharacterized membrane protein YczE
MKQLIARLIRLFFGLFLYALGIVLTMQAHIGYAPWEVFHAGLANLFSTQIGTMTISVGLVILIITFTFGEKVGLGTLCNMLFVGLFMNMLLSSGVFTERTNPVWGVVQMIGGLFVIAIATYFYITSGFGAGPRDSLMVLLSRKTGLAVGICRTGIEVTVTVIGYLLGGMLGWGTLLSAVAIGFCVQLTFALLRFDPKDVVHEDLRTSIKNLITATT